ncbi:hypothetical protein C1645_875123 [Glomus cerebriforme]|uniref:F-box domain-containing protein n=1 Tax=Glomus cerebriforme TaxID=658196 RepID=A0A397T0B6_9GLOM|nr:hypothetical protein C1645_875123 [Glomus cerebriforme]
MTCQLPYDCLSEIFEYLKGDKTALYSCLLVNRLWCKSSVRILWRDIWNLRYSMAYKHRPKVTSTILISILVACLPNESKELLYKNGIFIPTPTSKQPLFNYAAFCQVLSIYEICRIIDEVLEEDKNYLVVNEVIKMLMNEISSLKILTYYSNNGIPDKISFTCFSEERDCLIDLSELHCSSNLSSEFFYQLSQICQKLQSITIDFENMDFGISFELKELILLQNNLKNLTLSAFKGGDWTDIMPALIKHSNTLTRLHLSSNNGNLPLLFVALFPNLQEIKFSFVSSAGYPHFEDFNELQYVNFHKLQILNFPYQCPKLECMMKFLENNGKNLKEIYIAKSNNGLNLTIAKFCPNLKNLFTIFKNDELDILKIIFNSCQYLESIEIWCGNTYLSEKEVLETIAKHSPKNFCELKMYNNSISKLIPKDLETFFISWLNRIPKKLLTLIIIKEDYNSLEDDEENMKIIDKYENLGVIKFETKFYDED